MKEIKIEPEKVPIVYDRIIKLIFGAHLQLRV